MKVRLTAGAEIDVLSRSEYLSGVETLRNELAGIRAGVSLPLERDAIANPSSDAAGNIGGGALGPGVELYRVPVGRVARFNRISVSIPGATPAAPITSTSNPTAWMTLHRGGPAPSTLVLMLPISGVIAPVVVSEGDDSAVRLNGGETLTVIGAGLPVSTQIAFALQVRLDTSEGAGAPGTVTPLHRVDLDQPAISP